ncbi:hypothetical protein D3C75_1064910 [compost metagenome]
MDETHVIGHFQVDPVRKPYCPGPKFPWNQLYTTLKQKEDDVKMDKAYTVVNGTKLTEECVLIEGRVYVPLVAIGKAIGARVSWDNNSKMATLTTNDDK